MLVRLVDGQRYEYYGIDVGHGFYGHREFVGSQR